MTIGFHLTRLFSFCFQTDYISRMPHAAGGFPNGRPCLSPKIRKLWVNAAVSKCAQWITSDTFNNAGKGTVQMRGVSSRGAGDIWAMKVFSTLKIREVASLVIASVPAPLSVWMDASGRVWQPTSPEVQSRCCGGVEQKIAMSMLTHCSWLSH